MAVVVLVLNDGGWVGDREWSVGEGGAADIPNYN